MSQANSDTARSTVLFAEVSSLGNHKVLSTEKDSRLAHSAVGLTPPPGTCVSGIPTRLKFPYFVEKLPQAFPGETVETEEAASTMGRPLLALSRV